MASSIPKARRATASFQGASPVMKVPLDSRVVISRRRVGTVRYVGRLASDTGEWYGIALDEPKGDNDGSCDKERYFQCPPNHGVFVRRKEVKEAVKCPPSPGAHDSGDDGSSSGSSATEQQEPPASRQTAAVTPLMRTFKNFRKHLDNITIKTFGGDTAASSTSRPASPAASSIPTTPSGTLGTSSPTAGGAATRSRSGIKEPQSLRYATFTFGEALTPASEGPATVTVTAKEIETEAGPSATSLILSGLFDDAPLLLTERTSPSPAPSAMPLSAASRAQSFASPPPPPSPSVIPHPMASRCLSIAPRTTPSTYRDAPTEAVSSDLRAEPVETVLDLSTLMEISETLVLDGLDLDELASDPRDRAKSLLRRNSDSTVDLQESLIPPPPPSSPPARSASFLRRNSDSTVVQQLQTHEEQVHEQTQVEPMISPRAGSSPPSSLSSSPPRPMFLRRTNIGSPSRLERRASIAATSSGPHSLSPSSPGRQSAATPLQRNPASRIAELEREIYSMRSKHENVIAVLRATNQQHAANVLELRAQVAALTEGNNYLERQLASKLALLQELQQVESHDRVMRDEVARVMALKDAQIQALEKEIGKLKQHVLRVETERDSQLCQQFRHLSAARERDEERIARLRQDVVQLCNERTVLQSELHDLKEMNSWI